MRRTNNSRKAEGKSGRTRGRKGSQAAQAEAAYRRAHALSVDKVFRVLSDATRLRLLNLVNGREVCVCYLTEILGINQPKISRHLAYLRCEGLVAARREGKWMHYRLKLPEDRVAARILRGTLGEMQKDPRIRYDLAHLEAACCSPEKYELPAGAPLPAKNG